MKTAILGAVVVAAVLLAAALFTIDETEQAIVVEFGKFVRSVRDPGLHLKLPFVQTVFRYEKRLLRYDASPAEFLTRDKKALVVDIYARYRIADPLKFFQTMRDVERANARLDALISSALREAVASHDQSDIITDKREPIMANVGATTREKSAEFGVELLDVRIKRTDFPREIADSIYARMQAERGRISKRYRSEGREEELKIKAETDKEKVLVLAEAKRQSEVLRGQGDAEAIRIFADALGKDPEFYAFLKSLDTYRQSLKTGTRVILSSDSPLFQYLESPTARRP